MTTPQSSPNWLTAVLLSQLVALPALGLAAEQPDVENPEMTSLSIDTSDLPRIRVVAPDTLTRARVPGAVYSVTLDDIEEIQPRSNEDLLRRVPGIYIKREEDSAVVTNIGVRGLPAADYKTLMLEDGVPVQFGIFVGNSRYYSPRVQRMEGVEILKGASALRYGPNNIGGVINFLTRTPEPGLAVRARVGSWNTREAVLDIGARSDATGAYFGMIGTRASSDGWNDKGWEMTDVMIKAGGEFGLAHRLGVKFSYYENDANISYRGFFPDAFEAGARFNPAPDDIFETERVAFDLNHQWDISHELQLQSVFFWSDTRRDYWRFLVDGSTVNDVGLTVWNYTDTVQGNNRSVERYGFDTRLLATHSLLGINNAAELGLRYFKEEQLDVTLRADRASPRNPLGAPLRNRIDSGETLGLFAQNRFDISESLSITAGLRLESYEQRRTDRRVAGEPVDTFSNTEWLPGFGATYQINPAAQIYGSIYQAFAPPLVGSVVGRDDVPTAAEKSWNIDIGLRGQLGQLRYELAAFQMDFANQVDPGISNIRPPNEGSALIRGGELSIHHDFDSGFGLSGNLTWIPTAEFGEDRPGEALRGNRLPYSPEWAGNLALRYRHDQLRAALLFNYTGQVFGDGMNRTEIDPLAHMGGRIPGYYTVDLTGSYDISQQLQVFGGIQNLLDKRYIAGLRQGIYAGPERSFDIGMRFQF